MKDDKKNWKLPNKAICELCSKKAYGAILMKDEKYLRKLCKEHYTMKAMEWENLDLKSIYAD